MTKNYSKLNTFHTLGLKIIKNNLYKIFFIEHYQQHQKHALISFFFSLFWFYWIFNHKIVQYSNRILMIEPNSEKKKKKL
jgi:hypothetical protein